MPNRIYKSRSSGTIVEFSFRRVTCESSPTEQYEVLGQSEAGLRIGRCLFTVQRTSKILSIEHILVKEKERRGGGLGSLLLSEVTTYATGRFGVFSYVVAEAVVPLARGFYLLHGFRPTRDNMESNNMFVPPPEDGANFASNYFRARSQGPGAEIYRTSNNLSVTRRIFNTRVEFGRHARNWEVSPDLLLIRAREKSKDWELVS